MYLWFNFLLGTPWFFIAFSTGLSFIFLSWVGREWWWYQRIYIILRTSSRLVKNLTTDGDNKHENLRIKAEMFDQRPLVDFNVPHPLQFRNHQSLIQISREIKKYTKPKVKRASSSSCQVPNCPWTKKLDESQLRWIIYVFIFLGWPNIIMPIRVRSVHLWLFWF